MTASTFSHYRDALTLTLRQRATLDAISRGGSGNPFDLRPLCDGGYIEDRTPDLPFHRDRFVLTPRGRAAVAALDAVSGLLASEAESIGRSEVRARVTAMPDGSYRVETLHGPAAGFDAIVAAADRGEPCNAVMGPREAVRLASALAGHVSRAWHYLGDDATEELPVPHDSGVAVVLYQSVRLFPGEAAPMLVEGLTADVRAGLELPPGFPTGDAVYLTDAQTDDLRAACGTAAVPVVSAHTLLPLPPRTVTLRRTA